MKLTGRLGLVTAMIASSVGAAGLDQRTADLTSVIQEVVSRPGWAEGNSLVLVVSGTGERVAESADGISTDDAPMLHIEYSAP